MPGFGWRDNSSRVLALLGSLSAAAVIFGATSVGAAAPVQHLTQMQVGKRLPTIGYLNAASPVLRTRAQMDQYQAEHPSLGLQQHASGRPLIPMGEKAYRLAKQVAMQAARGEKPVASTLHPAPATHRALAAAGPSENDTGSAGVFPPDPTVAIGGGQIVVADNSTFNVYNRSGTALLNESMAAFLGGANIVQPRVLYDPIWKRWILLAVDVPTGGVPAFWVAASRTSNAAGNYAVYHIGFPFTAGDVWDYPMLGMTQDALVFTGNHFTSNGTVFSGSVLFGAAKSRFYNSLGFGAGLAGVPTGSGTIAPPVVQDGSDTAYFIGVNTASSQIDVYIGKDFESGNWSFTGSGSVAVSGIAVPPNAQQYNATQVLDTLDARFQGPSSQYTISGNDIVVWNTHTRALSGFAAPYFYEIDATTNTLLQNVDYFASGSSYDFNPSLAVNTNSEVFLNWSSTDPANHKNASVLFTGWQPGDGSTLSGTGSFLTLGGPALRGNPTNSSTQRWGAYSAVALDPSAPAACSLVPNRRAAMINEYTLDYKTWGTEFGIFGFC